MDIVLKNQVRSLAIKGFNKNEISRMVGVEEKDIEDIEEKDIMGSSEDLYNELQKDLSKLVITELNKGDRDSGVILNAIKLQAELQEKKIVIKRGVISSKVSKSYIYDRDEEIKDLSDKGLVKDDIAKRFGISLLSVEQALDRCSLKLSEELKGLSPTIISETIGLDKDVRLRVLGDAYANNWKRKDVREVVNKLKEKMR